MTAQRSQGWLDRRFQRMTGGHLQTQRYQHPNPRVQQRMEVLWLISCGQTYDAAARLAGVSPATSERYVAIYCRGGGEGLKQFDWHKLRVS